MTPPDAPKNMPARIWAWARGNPIVAILAALLVILLAGFLWVAFFGSEWIYGLVGVSKDEDKKFTALKSLGIAMGGVILAIQAANSHRRAVAMEESARAQARASEAQADAAKQQAEANRNAEKGLRQERLKNAIEHLGHEAVSVRLGGAYELFHLAQDNKELRQTALDILCAHIRRTTGEAEYREKHKSEPSEEIQSLLTLLFVQEHEVFDGLHINLQGSWLNGVNLYEARLRKAVLEGAHLKGANLVGARLQEVELGWARLQGAHLSDAHLQKADLYEAKLQGASLVGAELQGADIRGARLQGAHLLGAQLEGAHLWRAYLQGASLWEARLQGARLVEAHLRGADLTRARLQGSDLSGAHLQGSCLHEAQLQGADIEGAHLQGIVSTLMDSSRTSRFFAGNIRARAGRESDFSQVVFAGGLTREDVDNLVADLSDESGKDLRTKLASHIGKPVSHELPRNSGAVTGTYTKEQAEGWIAEYEAAMAEVPKKDAG